MSSRHDEGGAAHVHCSSRAPPALRSRACHRLDADLRRRAFLGGSAALLGLFAGAGLAHQAASAQTAPRQPSPARPLLLTNLRLFDGNTLSMQRGRNILVRGDRIAGLPAVGQQPADADVIDCGGRAVIPGLIDSHAHLTLAGISELVALTGDPAFVHLVSGQVAQAMLMQGFTTVRDVGGPAFGLKLAIDRGVLDGPRIFPAGAALSQTSGHGDFRMLSELPRMPSSPPSRVEAEGVMVTPMACPRYCGALASN